MFGRRRVGRKEGRRGRPEGVLTADGTVRHESGLILQKNEVMLRDYHVSTPDGSGWLIVTRLRAYVVIRRRGVHLWLDLSSINDAKVDGSELTIHWSERHTVSYRYTVRMSGGDAADALRTIYMRCSFDRAGYVSIPEEEQDAIRAERVARQERRVLLLEDEWAELGRRGEAMLAELGSGGPNCAKAGAGRSAGEGPKHGCSGSGQAGSAYVSEGGRISRRRRELVREMRRGRLNLYFARFDAIQRSALVPECIPNRDVYNDAYYDAKHDAYVTMTDRFPRTPENRRLRMEMEMPYGCGRSPERASDVRFVLGLPCIADEIASARNGWPCFLSVSSIGTANYHYLRFLESPSESLWNHDGFRVRTDTSGHNEKGREEIRMCLRLGLYRGVADSGSGPTEGGILAEDGQLATGGSLNPTGPIYNGTAHSDGDHISILQTPSDSWFPSPFRR